MIPGSWPGFEDIIYCNFQANTQTKPKQNIRLHLWSKWILFWISYIWGSYDLSGSNWKMSIWKYESETQVKVPWMNSSFWLLVTDNSDTMVLIIKRVIIIELDVLSWDTCLNSLPDIPVILLCHLMLLVGSLLQCLQRGDLISLTVTGTLTPS